MIPILHGLSEIAERYDGFIVDLWGVLHDGVRAFPPAVDCLERLRERGKRVLILSNAPRRAEAVAARNAADSAPGRQEISRPRWQPASASARPSLVCEANTSPFNR